MGEWNIIIQGIGPHHNNKEFDIERMFKKFIEEISSHGVHGIKNKSITIGSTVDINLIPPL